MLKRSSGSCPLGFVIDLSFEFFFFIIDLFCFLNFDRYFCSIISESVSVMQIGQFCYNKIKKKTKQQLKVCLCCVILLI